jgi:hypothetical protein
LTVVLPEKGCFPNSIDFDAAKGTKNPFINEK